jgi:hypothetical protein
MKRTSEDVQFALEFGRQLKLRYLALRNSPAGTMSEEQFATTLDVSRPALRKYFSGTAMPTVRTAALAYLRHGVSVSYFGTPLFGKLGSKSVPLPPAQLVLPFSVRGLNTSSVSAKIKPTGVNQFELSLEVIRAG